MKKGFPESPGLYLCLMWTNKDTWYEDIVRCGLVRVNEFYDFYFIDNLINKEDILCYKPIHEKSTDADIVGLKDYYVRQFLGGLNSVIDTICEEE